MFGHLSLELKSQRERITFLKRRFAHLDEFIGDDCFITDLQIKISDISSEVQTQQPLDITPMVNTILERIQINISNIEQNVKPDKPDFDKAKKEIEPLCDKYTRISTKINKIQQENVKPSKQQTDVEPNDTTQQQEDEEPSTQQSDADPIERGEQLQLEIVMLASNVDDVENKLNEIENHHDNLYKKLSNESDIIELLKAIIKQRERIMTLEVNLKRLDASIFDSLCDRSTKILSEINDMQLSTEQDNADINEGQLRDIIAALTSDIDTAESKLVERIESGITELSQEIIKQRERIANLNKYFSRFGKFVNNDLSASLRTQVSNISNEVQEKIIWQQQYDDVISMIRSISEKICASIPNVEQPYPDFDQAKETFDSLCIECTRISSEIGKIQQGNDANFDEREQQLQQLQSATETLTSSIDTLEESGNRLTDLYEKLSNELTIIQLFQEVIAKLDDLFKTKEYFESKLGESNKIKSRRKHITIAVAIIAIGIVCPVAIIFFKIQKLLFLALRIVIPFAITGFISITITAAFFIYQKRVSKTVGKKLKNTYSTIRENILKLNSLIQDGQNDSEIFCQTFRQMLTQ